MNAVAYFEIQASDTGRALAFYKDLFNWQFVREEFVAMPYWRIDTEGIHGGLMERPAAPPPPEYGTNAYVCSLEVANFDRTAETILAAGGQVALPKFAIPGRCWQGYFLDTENNTFGIFQVDPEAA